MKLLDNIKARIGKQVIDGRIKNIQRDARFLNIGEAGSIGIIYDATDAGSFGIVKDFSKQLTDRKINLSVLGYVDSKELAEDYLYRKGFDFFCRKQLNWYFKPVSEVTDKFMNERFDILLDLSLEKTYPLQFITALSPARFKAGRYTQDDPYLDFMIDISGETRMNTSSANKMNDNTMQVRDDLKNKNLTGGGNSQAEDSGHKSSETIKPGFSRSGIRKSGPEAQLSYLIEQLIHYLSIIKNN